jgi:NAD(P)-dependent dehydrogenase (short-subunit alcohol dehydrogenase family)
MSIVIGRDVAWSDERSTQESDALVFVQHDLSDEQGCYVLVAHMLSRFDRLGILVNSVSIMGCATLENLSYAEFRLHVEMMKRGGFNH